MKFTVKTGFGYFRDSNGNIISRYTYPPGEYPIKDGYSAVEVKTKVDLDKIILFEQPITIKVKQEKLIQEEIRKIAVESLKSRGELPASY